MPIFNMSNNNGSSTFDLWWSTILCLKETAGSVTGSTKIKHDPIVQSCHAYKGAPGLSYRNRSQIESGQPERRKGQSQGNPFPEMVNLSLFHGLISSYGPMTFLHSDLVWGDDSRTSQDFTPLLAGSASSLERFRPGRTALTESLPGAVILGSSIDTYSNGQNPSVGKVP